MCKPASRFRRWAARLSLVIVLGCAAIGGLYLVFRPAARSRTDRVTEGQSPSPPESSQVGVLLQGNSEGLDEFGHQGPVPSASPGALPSAHAPLTSTEPVPSFRPEDIAAARRLEPDPPAEVVWETQCQDQGSKDFPGPGLSPQFMVRSVRLDLRGHEEFPEGSHIVRWEMAFGLRRQGVLLWAEWLGTRPATYRVIVQDSRVPRSTWISSNRAPEQVIAEGFDWSATVGLLKERRAELTRALGPADYRRVIVTSESDKSVDAVSLDSSSAASGSQIVGAELLGARILWYSRGRVSCLRRDDDAMLCSCRGLIQH